jgi:hypothetical protein
LVSRIPDCQDITGIIAVQAFDGYWDLRLPGFANVPWHQFAQLQGIEDHHEAELVQQTLYTLAVLEKFGSAKRELWSIVSEKAKEWLETKVPLTEWDALITELQGFVA